MTITQDDIRLYQSQRMTDDSDGGGMISTTAVVDGVKNNVWPDLDDVQRAIGCTQLRKVFGAVRSAGADTLYSAHAGVFDAPDDPAVNVVLMAYGGLATERASAVYGLQSAVRLTSLPVVFNGAGMSSATTLYGVTTLSVGDAVAIVVGGHAYVRHVVAVAVDATLGPNCTLDREVATWSSGGGVQVWGYDRADGTGTVRCMGICPVTGSLAAGTTSVVVTQRMQPVVPLASEAQRPTPAPSTWGVELGGHLVATGGWVQVVAASDAVLVHHTAVLGPTTVANGQTVNLGRTGLARVRVIAATGVEHARFTRNVPPPAGKGCLADLDAGTITISDVSGIAQPVTIEHRIEELTVVTAVADDVSGTSTLTLNRALSRSFPAGAFVSSLAMLGTLASRVSLGFAQLAWTGAFSDSVIGGQPTADFNRSLYPIVCSNAGAITDRWALVFTSNTQFRVIGEAVGEVGGGSTGADCAPLNPATGAAYFSLPQAGWGAGWAAGNVYRFNTEGAMVPLWLVRCVLPSAPGGADSATVELRGFVNS